MATQLTPYSANIPGPYMEQFGPLPPRPPLPPEVTRFQESIKATTQELLINSSTNLSLNQKLLDPNRFTVPTSKFDASPPSNQLINQLDRTANLIIASCWIFSTIFTASIVWRTSLATRYKIAISLAGGTAIIILICVNPNIGGVAFAILGVIAFALGGDSRHDNSRDLPPLNRHPFQLEQPQSIIPPSPRFSALPLPGSYQLQTDEQRRNVQRYLDLIQIVIDSRPEITPHSSCAAGS
jgi:hypothetical protein